MKGDRTGDNFACRAAGFNLKDIKFQFNHNVVRCTPIMQDKYMMKNLYLSISTIFCPSMPENRRKIKLFIDL